MFELHGTNFALKLIIFCGWISLWFLGFRRSFCASLIVLIVKFQQLTSGCCWVKCAAVKAEASTFMPCAGALQYSAQARPSWKLLKYSSRMSWASYAQLGHGKHQQTSTHLWRRLWFLLAHCGSCGWAQGSLQRLAVPDWNHWQWLCIRSGHWLQWASGRGQHRRWPLWNQSRWGAKLSAKFPRIPRFPRIHVGKEFSCWKSQNFQTSPSVQVGQTGFLRGSATLAQF